MLDEFGSYEPRDYLGGFPAHPHRGFETVTYMLEGSMEHRDHMGNVGLLESGDVQWMKAGAGVIHSEMPRQREGRMRGFQLWLNLPAAEKMSPAAYRDIAAAEIPSFSLDGADIKAIAGRLKVNGRELAGAVTGGSTRSAFLDVRTDTEAVELEVVVPDGHAAPPPPPPALCVRRQCCSSREANPAGCTTVGPPLHPGEIRMQLEAQSRALLLTGRPIGEPIVHYGPFVMNSREEIEQAISDYNAGSLVK